MDELTRKRLARTLAVQSCNTSMPLPPLPKPPSPPTTNKEQKIRIDCKTCVHFFVTWEKNCPYGCKAYGFKGPQIPSILVKTTSGENCNFFKQRV